MAQLFDYVDYLSREIGARPAGTEEEQQAALYIAEQFQKDAGFHTDIEEFTSSSNIEGASAILCAIVIVASILAMLFNMLAIPAFILILVAAAIYILEALDRPFISKALSRGASQNVVSKYQPGGEDGASKRGHARKIILVAHYDTGKVKPGIVKRVESMNAPIGLVCMCGMAAATFFMLLRIFFGTVGGIGIILLNVLTVLSLIVVSLPMFKAILYRFAPYNEGANNNATGVAALIELASRVSQGSISEADLAQISEEVTMHGEEAARESGLVPEGVELSYEEGSDGFAPVDDFEEFESFSEEERLLAAKAAIAALTGRPVESRVYSSIDEPATPMRDHGAFEPAADYPIVEPIGQEEAASGFVPATIASAQASQKPAVVEAAESVVGGFQNAPSWFVSAQKNAKKAPESDVKVQRSRYSSALDDAERELERREQLRQEEEAARLAEQQRMMEEQARLAEEQRLAAIKEAEELVARKAEAEAAEQPARAQAEAAKAAEPADDGEPVEEMALEPAEQDEPSEGAQVDLGSTIAFDPRMLETEELADGEDQAQSKPADDEEQAPKLLDLPEIDQDQALEEPKTDNPSRSGMFRKLRTDIPSLSGAIGVEDDSDAAPAEPEPVDYDMELSLEGEPAIIVQPEATSGIQNVQMPASRADGFLGARKKGGKDLEETPQEWLGVDEDFNAREVGKKRGSWESFRDESSGWEGGAFSRVRLGRVNMLSGENMDSDVPDELVETTEDRVLNDEIEQIIHFRNPSINSEVWFVAIGSDTDWHDGARAFVEEHRSELRGSMIIELESLGAGALSVASEEGRFRPIKTSSRTKRFTRGATEATGIALDQVRLNGADSIASTMQRAGFQAMHLFGAEDGLPALKGSADDVVENVDELILEENVDYVMELLKNA